MFFSTHQTTKFIPQHVLLSSSDHLREEFKYKYLLTNFPLSWTTFHFVEDVRLHIILSAYFIIPYNQLDQPFQPSSPRVHIPSFEVQSVPKMIYVMKIAELKKTSTPWQCVSLASTGVCDLLHLREN